MNAPKHFRSCLFASSVFFALQSLQAFTQSNPDAPTAPAEHARDGQHDFDFAIGVWRTHLSRLLNPLTGSKTWVEFEGTTVVRKVWDGRANLAELDAKGPSGRIQALSLRLYNPQSRQWSLNAANIRTGTLSVPTIGEFRNGRGEFYDHEEFNGRAILVRNVWSDITPDSCRFEQAFSDDGGKTWEVNWIAVDTRVKEESDLSDRQRRLHISAEKSSRDIVLGYRSFSFCGSVRGSPSESSDEACQTIGALSIRAFPRCAERANAAALRGRPLEPNSQATPGSRTRPRGGGVAYLSPGNFPRSPLSLSCRCKAVRTANHDARIVSGR